MPRTLPWLAGASKDAGRKPASSPLGTVRRKRAASPSSDLVDSDLNPTGVATSVRRAKQQRAGRSPSTSPPPAPTAPPDVEYMREGYEEDDIWMMVEDEFHSTAQSFTQHIHHAEYVRLKQLAKGRATTALEAIARPIDGRTQQSASTKIRLEADAQARKVKAGVASMCVVSEGEEDDCDAYMQDPQLAGLMTSSQKVAQDLTGLAKARADTRAAAGFAKSPPKRRVVAVSSKVTELSDVGSDAPSDLGRNIPAAKAVRAKSTSDKSGSRSTKNDEIRKVNAEHDPAGNGSFKRFTVEEDDHKDKSSGSHSRRLSGQTTHQVRHENLQTSNHLKHRESSPPPARSQATSDFLAKRKAREAARQKSAEKDKDEKSQSTIAVPTFIF
ncbi:hypothetical protein LTR62_003907 [Meristemomyces frigidus]|uniref:Uncharacterized protein n=1 Tax=Meristemomyces frigidus TaxID=1508187 RepID=A0AAN7YRH6_9PEZI|nr:hypothetical protein LTR62_003907 [Meristemomyces frigidus]